MVRHLKFGPSVQKLGFVNVATVVATVTTVATVNHTVVTVVTVVGLSCS